MIKIILQDETSLLLIRRLFMNVNPKEYRQKIHSYSKSTLEIISEIMSKAKIEQDIYEMHQIIIKAQSEQEVIKNLTTQLTQLTNNKQ